MHTQQQVIEAISEAADIGCTIVVINPQEYQLIKEELRDETDPSMIGHGVMGFLRLETNYCIVCVSSKVKAGNILINGKTEPIAIQLAS